MSGSKRWIAFNFDQKETKDAPKKIKKPVATKSVVAVPNEKLKSFKFFDKIDPKNIEDLAVHAKKIKEVEEWLDANVINPTTKVNVPMLLLTGPTGAGKTTVVKVLCQCKNIDIQEWINPIDKDFETFKGPGQSVRLQEFLTESKFPSLLTKASTKKKVTLIEDFPNTLLKNTNEFEGILDNCLANGKTCLIFICTEVHNNKVDIAKNLFTEEIKDKFNICNINFNSCSVTLLKNALNRAQNIVKENLDILKLPRPKIIEAIIATAMGDIRCAVNQYYFASLKGASEIPLELSKLEKTGQKRKRVDKNSKVKSMNKDEALGLFHGLGKVFNPKRDDNNKVQCDFDALVDEFSTVPNIFNAFLFENYTKYFGDINDIFEAADTLSFSQTFMDKWSERHDTLIIPLWISVLGLMISNKHRVSKWIPINGPKKIDIKSRNNLEMRHLAVGDQSYYNLITKSEKYHKFKYLR
ncbi:PREDICTED: cell cycle checkpoint protein RAD17 [Nicrophorus vespilloides]|uniref:Cell cycle checkpoint protein RAD17 n=1 Tax=Nicrophorus vespilloides TaxID=110193 RepID=A0ABM1M779_NICVS|nr:PREDICTED: cell cycle checkpoint protein RAD17 [Nicrophorus vespilloides]